MTDPISDMIIRVKNAYLARKTTVNIPYTKVLHALANLLKEEKYVEEVKVEETKPVKTLVLTLRYVKRIPAITDVKRISKPGLRRYTTADKIPQTLGGYGLTIVTTSQGVMSDKQARAKGIGGELLCSIW